MGGAVRSTKTKDDYGSRFSPAQESREIHQNEDIVVWFSKKTKATEQAWFKK